ncbi:MAG: alpha/beta hydrolase [Bryobacteraceae bacterium]|nr:alpha/beta hydrolase [Bryobacteraceae bacterium]
MSAASLEDYVEHGYAKSGDVKIHYAAIGKGPLVVMIHGFPDYWYTWRKQMQPLAAAGFRVAAMDLRGYNLSDKPKGIESYDMKLLVSDVLAVIRSNGASQAVVVGHDWGGAIAWNVAMFAPDAVERLIILNLPHPRGLARELASNPEQQKNSGYAREFQKPDSHKALTAEGLAGWVTDAEAKPKYVEAFGRSDFEAMMNFYKRNYPRSDGNASLSIAPAMPKVKAPVLMIHGLKDKALMAPALNNTWEWLEQDLTLVTIPNAEHFVQQDAADLVTKSMLMWLRR